MNARKKRSCDDPIDRSATQAAIRAGYSPMAAYSIGCPTHKEIMLELFRGWA